VKKVWFLIVVISILFLFTYTDAMCIPESIYIDLGVIDIIPDTIYTNGSAISIGAVIGNFGNINMINVPVMLLIIGTSYTSTRMISLNAGSSAMMHFDPFVCNIPIPESIIVVCTIWINDSNPANNSRCETLIVLPLGIEQEKSVSTYNTITFYPNPFTSNLQISSELNRDLEVEIYNTNGSLVKRLSGSSKITWDGKDSRNNLLPAGIYFLKIPENDNHTLYRVLLLR